LCLSHKGSLDTKEEQKIDVTGRRTRKYYFGGGGIGWQTDEGIFICQKYVLGRRWLTDGQGYIYIYIYQNHIWGRGEGLYDKRTRVYM